jgi:hypothetical protein
MTALDHVQHALGVLSLTVLAGAGGFSLYAMVATIAPALPRMRAALRGPVSPAASATPHVAPNPQRRGVEAAAAPALQVRP